MCARERAIERGTERKRKIEDEKEREHAQDRQLEKARNRMFPTEGTRLRGSAPEFTEKYTDYLERCPITKLFSLLFSLPVQSGGESCLVIWGKYLIQGSTSTGVNSGHSQLAWFMQSDPSRQVNNHHDI